jgi:hypothetical protein
LNTTKNSDKKIQRAISDKKIPSLEKVQKRAWICNGPKFKNGLKLNLALMFKHGPNIGRGLMT